MRDLSRMVLTVNGRMVYASPITHGHDSNRAEGTISVMHENSKVVMTVPEAGRKLGLGRNAAYEAAARGDIPTIKIGKLLRVPIVAFDRMLEQAGLSR